MQKILAVDDDLNLLRLLKMRLEAKDYAVTTFTEAEDAMETARDEEFDMALLDLKLTRGNGIELMETLHHIHPEMPVVILTAYGTIESAVEAMKRGAYSYLTKPFNHRELLLQIKNGIEKSRLSKEVKRLREIVKERYEFENIIGESEEMRKVLDLVSHSADTDSNVYIYGESGTGKELIAKALHLASSRKERPFVAINCAAIPEALLEGELFGFRKGAFTGAVRTKKGLFVQAHGGSILLDEISEMPFSMQSKLLRVLEEREFYPLGSEKPVKVDVRIIATSNKDLEKEIEEGNFRRDLFYRIHVIPIKLPPLREKRGDIPLLAEHFLRKLSGKAGKYIGGFSPTALQKMMLYSWPGNVRELQNVIECAVAMCMKDVISEDLLLPTGEMKENDLKPLKEAKSDFEQRYIIELMELTQGNVTHAAKLAKKYRADLYKLLEKYNLKPKDFKRKSSS